MEQRRQTQSTRTRKPSQLEVFKETYLPALIVCVAFLLIFIFTIGSITRAIQTKKAHKLIMEQAQLSSDATQTSEKQEAAELLAQAQAYVADYNYEDAIASIDSFSGDINKYPEMVQLREHCVNEQANLVLWDSNIAPLNLSFHHLIADSNRAFNHETEGSSYQYHYITTTEFNNILLQLYENNYILVSMDDVYSVETDDEGNAYMATKPLYLPVGKKPLIITQTQVNYYTYLIDGDGDKLPDAQGGGFASKLIIDENGNVTCEIVNADGSVTTGAYDLIPILDSFIATHPDFSYRGAKAIIALTGYEGLFGYRTAGSFAESFDINAEISNAVNVLARLRDTGYDIACYTYGNIAYGDAEPQAIQADLSGWNTEVMPLLGDIDILVYAKGSDIAAPSSLYEGEKYTALRDAGFKFFIGFCDTVNPWQMVTDSYVRQGRLLVTGNNLQNAPELFNGIFDVGSVLDNTRK